MKVLAAPQKKALFINCAFTAFVPAASSLSRDTTNGENCHYFEMPKCTGMKIIYAVALVVVAQHCWCTYIETELNSAGVCVICSLHHCIIRPLAIKTAVPTCDWPHVCVKLPVVCSFRLRPFFSFWTSDISAQEHVPPEWTCLCVSLIEVAFSCVSRILKGGRIHFTLAFTTGVNSACKLITIG